MFFLQLAFHFTADNGDLFTIFVNIIVFFVCVSLESDVSREKSFFIEQNLFSFIVSTSVRYQVECDFLLHLLIFFQNFRKKKWTNINIFCAKHPILLLINSICFELWAECTQISFFCFVLDVCCERQVFHFVESFLTYFFFCVRRLTRVEW